MGFIVLLCRLGALLEIRHSVVSLVGGCGCWPFFSLSRAGWSSKPLLKVLFLLFFVSFLFVLCRFGRFGVQAWFVQIGFSVFAV